MSKKKLLIRLGKAFVISVLSYVILSFFTDSLTASIILVVGVIVYSIGNSLLGFYRAKRKSLTQVLPPSDDIPIAVQGYDKTLKALGFEHVNMTSYKGRKGFVYWNDTHTHDIMVAYSEIADASVRFSTYLADGFDVMTDYPTGLPSESEKISRHIVESSLEATFDYHQHHVQKNILKHGNPHQFETIQEIINWEGQHQLRVDAQKNDLKFRLKGFLRLVLAMILAYISWYVVMFIIQYGYHYFDAKLPSYYGLMSNLIFFILSIIFGIWAYRPVYKPETVEDRKKKELA